MAKKNRAAGNTVILTATNAFNRVVGFVYRIFLIRLAGQEAVGLFQMIFPTYFLFLVLATAGLPIAVSKLVAEHRAKGDQAGAKAVLRTAALTALVLGLAANVLLFLLSGQIANQLLNEPRTRLALLIIAPSLPLVALSAVFRGYFQGIEEIKVVSGSLLAEQITHVLATLGLVSIAVSHGPVYLAAGLAAGSILGEFVGLAVYLVTYPFYRPSAAGKYVRTGAVLGALFAISIPATATRLVQSLAQVASSVLIPNGLRASGLTASQAAIAFGELTGMALNILFVPSLFTISLATTLLPQVTAAASRQNMEQARLAFVRALKWTAVLSLPCSALFITLGEPLCLFLFNSRSAGRLLSFLAWGGLLMYLQQISAATLQGLGRPALPMVASIVGTTVSAYLLYQLTPVLRMQGAALALIVGFTVTGLISLAMVEHCLKFAKHVGLWLVKALAAAVVAGYISQTVYVHGLANLGRSFPSMVAAGLAASLAYMALVKALKLIEA